MPFSEELKLKIKEMSNFTCCWCQDIKNKVEIHHIIPQSQGGDDSFENAAPLCSNCHTMYGNNKDLRKEIKQRKDYWLNICLKRNGIDIDNKHINVTIFFKSKIYSIQSNGFNGSEWDFFIRSTLASAFLSNNEDINRKDFEIGDFKIVDINRKKWLKKTDIIDSILFPGDIALIYKDDLENEMFGKDPEKIAIISKFIGERKEQK